MHHTLLDVPIGLISEITQTIIVLKRLGAPLYESRSLH